MKVTPIILVRIIQLVPNDNNDDNTGDTTNGTTNGTTNDTTGGMR